jgi:hypothetical protein
MTVPIVLLIFGIVLWALAGFLVARVVASVASAFGRRKSRR